MMTSGRLLKVQVGDGGGNRGPEIWLPVALLLLAAVLGTAESAASDRGTAHRSTVFPTRMDLGPYLPPSPDTEPSDCVRCRSVDHSEPRAQIPIDPRIDLASLGPNGPPTQVPVEPPSFSGAPKAPGDFTIYRTFDFSPTELAGARYGYVMEPSFDTDGRAVFWTGNKYAAYSENYGRAFRLINTFDNFPPDGDTDLVMDGVFCCDQDVVYDRTRGAWFWLMLYHVAECDSINVQRLAVAPTTEAMLNNQWYLYDFSPLNYGHTREEGLWLDFPHLTLGQSYLYHVTKMFKFGVMDTCYNKTGIKEKEEHREDKQLHATNHLVARYPLDDMVQGLPIAIEWFETNETHGMRGCAGSTGSAMYLGSHLTNTTLRVFVWPDNSPNWFAQDVAHNGFDPTRPFEASGPVCDNWAGRMDNYIQGAWAANGVLGFMFAATVGGGHTYPGVHIVRVVESDRTLLSHDLVWNPDYGFAFPNCHPNDRGDVAGVMAFGGGDLNPNMLAWVADDYNGGVFQPLEVHQFTFGDSGPDTVWWGDYFTARRNVPYGNTWGGSGVCLIGGCAHSHAHGYYVWFGRERDTPPAHHTIYVDWANISSWEDGSAAHPYNTVNEGHFAAVDGDTIIVRAGTYPETVVLSTEVHVKSEGGITVIGP